MQQILILLIVSVCAAYIGRRLYRNIRKPESGCGCDCGCSGCGPDMESTCHPDKRSDNS